MAAAAKVRRDIRTRANEAAAAAAGEAAGARRLEGRAAAAPATTAGGKEFFYPVNVVVAAGAERLEDRAAAARLWGQWREKNTGECSGRSGGGRDCSSKRHTQEIISKYANKPKAIITQS